MAPRRPARKRLGRKPFEKRTLFLFSAGAFLLAANNVHQGWKHVSRTPSLQHGPSISLDEDVVDETVNETRGEQQPLRLRPLNGGWGNGEDDADGRRMIAVNNTIDAVNSTEHKREVLVELVRRRARNESAIDAVFTYVNGSDPELHETLKPFGKVLSAERIRDLGQLRWAMRSAYINTPFIRNFIVVVSSKATQIPSWLNATHPRVRVVEHSEIWDDPSDLPSMNSHAIEWNTPNIPDIARHYFLFNDDMAIQTPLERASVWPGHTVYEAWRAPVTASQVRDAYGKSIAFVSGLYNERYGRRRGRKVAAHVPILVDAGVMRTIRGDFPAEFGDMYRAKPFRTHRDMQTQFAYQQYVMQHFPYKTVASSSKASYMSGLSNDYSRNEKEFEMVKSKPRRYICFQDEFGDADPSSRIREQISRFYDDLFPRRGPWEIDI